MDPADEKRIQKMCADRGVNEFASRIPERITLRDALQRYGGGRHLPDEYRQKPDDPHSYKIMQNTRREVLLEAWDKLLKAAPAGMLVPLYGIPAPPSGGSAAGEGGSRRSGATSVVGVGPVVGFGDTVDGESPARNEGPLGKVRTHHIRPHPPLSPTQGLEGFGDVALPSS